VWPGFGKTSEHKTYGAAAVCRRPVGVQRANVLGLGSVFLHRLTAGQWAIAPRRPSDPGDHGDAKPRLRRAAGVAGVANGLSEQTRLPIGHRLDDERTVEEDVAHLTARLGEEQAAVAGSAMQGAIIGAIAGIMVGTNGVVRANL
jgi:hypothetical protein